MVNQRYAKVIAMAAALQVGAAGCGRQEPSEASPQAAAQPTASRPFPAPTKLPQPQSGAASYYGPEFSGARTASGERHDPNKMTAASRTLPLGTIARVTNRETGRSVAVKVNDRGPYIGRRILDVSRRAAIRLGMKEDGVAKVKVQPLKVPAESAGRGGQREADG